jgi:CBS domain-containing protein
MSRNNQSPKLLTLSFLMDLRNALENETVSQVGYSKPITMQSIDTVRAAVEKMGQENTGCLLILDGIKLVGIFTERDFVIRVLGKNGAFEEPIKNYMTPDPTKAGTEEPIHRVLSRFLQCDVRNLPVVNNDDIPVGTLAVRRVVNFLSEYHPSAVYNLPPDADQIHSSREGG